MNATHTFSSGTPLPGHTMSTVDMIRDLQAPRPFTPRADAPAPTAILVARAPLETALVRAAAIAVAAVAATALFLALGPASAPSPEVDTAAVSADASAS